MTTEVSQAWSKEDLDTMLSRLCELEDRIRGLQDRVSAVRNTFAVALSQAGPQEARYETAAAD